MPVQPGPPGGSPFAAAALVARPQVERSAQAQQDLQQLHCYAVLLQLMPPQPQLPQLLMPLQAPLVPLCSELSQACLQLERELLPLVLVRLLMQALMLVRLGVQGR